MAVTVASAGLLFALSARYRSLATTSLALHDPLGALAENLRALPVALSLWARPGSLSIEHPPPPEGALWIAAGAALALGLTSIAIAARRRAPNLALAAGWVVVALLPTHTLLARAEAVTQRPLYLAWAGPALLAGAAALALARAARPAQLALRALPAVAAVGLVLAAASAAHERARLWTDEASLWRAAVDRAPASPRAWSNLGAAYLGARDYARARAAFRAALEIDPRFASARAGVAGLALVAPEIGGGDPP